MILDNDVILKATLPSGKSIGGLFFRAEQCGGQWTVTSSVLRAEQPYAEGVFLRVWKGDIYGTSRV